MWHSKYRCWGARPRGTVRFTVGFSGSWAQAWKREPDVGCETYDV